MARVLQLYLILGILAALLVACGTGRQPASQAAVPTAPADATAGQANLPPLPLAPPAFARRGSSASDVRLGAEYYAKSDHVAVGERDATFSPPFRDYAWALYEFAADQDDVVESVSYFAHDRTVASTPVYLALADYSTGQWRFFDPASQDSGYFAVEAAAGQHTSPGHAAYVAVLAFSGDGFSLDSVELAFTNRTPPPAAWPTFGHDNRRTHRSPELVVESANVQFKAQLPLSFVKSAPAVGPGGVIYIGGYALDNKGALYALNPDGSTAWSYRALEPVDSSPALGTNTTIYFGDQGGFLYALNAVGNRRWLFNAGREIYGPPAVSADGAVCFGTLGSELLSLSPTGSQQWSADTAAGVQGGAAIAEDGRIYVGTTDGALVALEADGSERWTYSGSGEVFGTPAIASDGTILYATEAGNFYAVSPAGDEVGSYAAGGEFYASPALSSDGKVYLGNTDGKLYIFDTSTDLLDRFDAGAPIKASAAIDGDDTVFFGTTAGRLVALTPSLEIQWQYQTGVELRVTPVVGADGLLLVPAINGTLYAFKDNDPYPPAKPSGLDASDGLYAAKIVLTWDEGYDADGYRIYKDGAPDPVAEVGYVQFWEDQPVEDTDAHSYRLEAFNDYGDSPLSDSDTGFSAGAPQLAPWAMWRGDPARTNAAAVAGPALKPAPADVDFGNGHEPSPVACAQDGRYFVKSDGWLYAYNADGSEDWSYQIEYGDLTPPVLGPGGDIYIYLNGGRVEAITAQGTHHWYFEPPDTDSIYPSAVADDGTLYAFGLGSGDPLLYAVTPDGEQDWTYPSGHDEIYVYPATGSDGTLYVPNRVDRLLAIDAGGVFKWQYLDEAAASAAVCVRRAEAGDLVYFNTAGGLVCLDEDKAEQWTFPALGYPALAPDGRLFLCASHKLYTINSDGSEHQSLTLPDFNQPRQAVADSTGTLFAMDDSDVLRAYDVELSELWNLQTLGSFDDGWPALGPDGRLFINDTIRRLFIFAEPE